MADFYDPNNPFAQQPTLLAGPEDPQMALAGGPIQQAGPTQAPSMVAPGGIPMELSPEAQAYSQPGLEAQMPTDGTIGGGRPAADMSGPAEALANNTTKPADDGEALFGGLGITGVLGIANMAAGMGRQIYEALKPKKKPRQQFARPPSGNPMG